MFKKSDRNRSTSSVTPIWRSTGQITLSLAALAVIALPYAPAHSQSQTGIPAACQGYVRDAINGGMSAVYKAAACLEANASMQLKASNPAARALRDAANQNARVVNSLKSGQ
jgi:hypothetical protein